MIKAYELRSGNLVIKKSSGSTPNHIDTVDGAYIKWVEENGAECYGIPLTPEILLSKLGFVKALHNEVYEYYDNGIFLLKKTDEGFIRIDLSLFIEEYLYITYKYLHQLQNLYFALTGKDLPIKNLQTTN